MRSEDDLVKLCACEFEHYVDALFQASRERGDSYCPIIKRLYPELDNDYLIKLKHMTCAALAARKWFRQHGLPGIILPLNFADIERAQRDESSRVNLVGLYASSLMMLEYDYLTHPQFHDYACGLMACEHTQDYLRNNPELLAEFTPRKLEGLGGLGGGSLYWPPEKVAEWLQIFRRNCQYQYYSMSDEEVIEQIVDFGQCYPSRFAGL